MCVTKSTWPNLIWYKKLQHALTLVRLAWRLRIIWLFVQTGNAIFRITGDPLPVLQNNYGLIWLAILDLWRVYFIPFMDISHRLAGKASCTNRKCNISDFGGQLRTLQSFMGSSDWPSSTCGGLFYDFYPYLYPFGRARQVSSDGTTCTSPISIPWICLGSRQT